MKHAPTLGDVLYSKSTGSMEEDWAALIRSIAAGDPLALQALYERAHRIVFTLMLRLTASETRAEELTLEIFREIWRNASEYDPADGTVLIWLMNRARARGMEQQANPADVVNLRQQSDSLNTALQILTARERHAIEATFFHGFSYAEAAVRLTQPLGTIKTCIRSGLHKLRQSVISANDCEQSEFTCAYAVQALAPSEIAAAEVHIDSCPDCRRELESLRPVLDRLICWPTDVLRPATSLQGRLASLIEDPAISHRALMPLPKWSEPEWEQVAPGIECKLLASDTERHRVSMLVRLAPGGRYPAHTHAGREELHLLHGELWIDGRKLVPGDYNLGLPGEGDESVWSETGCSCLLVTSTRDVLR